MYDVHMETGFLHPPSPFPQASSSSYPLCGRPQKFISFHSQFIGRIVKKKVALFGDPSNSLSPLNSKSRSAINLVILTTRYNTGLQYCFRRSTCCVCSISFRPNAFNLLLKAIIAFNVPLTAHDYVDYVLVNVCNHRIH